MKKLLLLCSLFVGTSALVSCSSDDDSSDGGGDPIATAITLSTDAETIEMGGSVTFTVMNDLDQNVTSSSTFMVDGTAITSNVFTPEAAGTYEVVAENGSLTSNTVTVTVTEVATAITLSSDVEVMLLGETATFTVMNDLESDVTATSTYYVDGTAIDSNEFTPIEGGEYIVYAQNGELQSNEITIVVLVENGEGSMTFDGTEYSTNSSALLYLGSTATQSYWIARTEKPGSGEGIDIYFSTTQSDPEFLDFPSVSSYTHDAAATLGNAPGEVTITGAAFYMLDGEVVEMAFETETEDLVTTLDLNITAFNLPEAEGDPQDWTIDYSVTLTNGTVITGDFTGDWAYYNASGRSSGSQIAVKLLDLKEVKALKR